MLIQRYNTRHEQLEAWTNRKFHTALFVGTALMVFMFKGALAIGNDLSNKITQPVAAQQELVSPVAIITPTPEPTPLPNYVSPDKWEQFKIAAQKVSRIYNYPYNVVLAQGRLESARGQSNFCQLRNNCLGIGAVDWDPNQAYKFENMEQSIVEYMRIIRKNFPTAWANRSNPRAMIDYIKYDPATNLQYATDPLYINKVTNLPEWSE